MTRFRLAPAALLVALALTPPGCALEGTGGALVPVDLAIAAAPGRDGALHVFETELERSWEVELEAAFLTVGAVYLFPPQPTAALRLRRSLGGLFVGTAHAHAGDDNLFGVTALAEYREEVVLDALSTSPVQLGCVLAESGEPDVASFWLDRPRTGDDGPTRGTQALVRGVARRDGVEIPFEATMALPETPLGQRVDLVEVAGAPLVEGGQVRFEVLTEHCLRLVDFSLWLEEGVEPDEDGVYRPGERSRFHQGWLPNFRDPSAFRVEVTMPPEGQETAACDN